jgi:tetratricopeptide (TPR) repeat protein
LIGEALKLNASYVPAHVLMAQVALDDGKRDEAKESLRKALAVNPNSLEARSIDAAIAFLEDRTNDFNTKVADILKINPRYSDVYRLAAEVSSHNYRYIEATDFAKRAVALDPQDPQAASTLGLQLLRTNDEAGARVVLERAFKGDPYDVVTYNLLSMMDALDKFVTVRDGDVVVRLSADEAPVMRDYLVTFAKESLAKLSKQWNFTPQGPILVEMFPEARRLRGAHDGAARDDRRARRLLRPGRGIRLAKGAAARRIQLAGNPVARVDARHHAADVEQPYSALADGRHFSLAGSAGEARLGA